MADIPMTPEQQKLVENNHNLIYWFIHRRGLQDDEYYDLIAIALCRAAQDFNESEGTAFTTYAVKCMEHALCNYWTTISRKKIVPPDMILSMNQTVKQSHGEKTLDELMDDENAITTIDHTRVDVEQFVNGLKPKYRKATLYLMGGYGTSDVARFMGCTTSRVNQIRGMVGKEWNRFVVGHREYASV